jgi:hypothetical protein
MRGVTTTFQDASCGEQHGIDIFLMPAVVSSMTSTFRANLGERYDNNIFDASPGEERDIILDALLH